MVYQRMLSDNSLLLKSPYGGTLLFIYSKCNSLFVTPNPSLSLLHPLATTSLFSPSMSLSLFCLWVHLCHILDSTCKWYHMVFVILFLTYFTYNSLAVPMLLQTAFFLWLSLIPFVHMHHIFFIHSSVDGHLGCFHVLAVVNSAAMNIGVHVSFWITVFSGYVPSNGIAGSYRSSVFSFLRNLHTVLLSDCISLHSRQQCMKWKVKVKSLSRVRLLATPWTAAYQALPSMGFSRQVCWSGVLLPSPSVQSSTI